MALQTTGFITSTGGQFPILGSSAAAWTIREGTQPVIEYVEMEPSQALACVSRAQGKPCMLTLFVNDSKVDVKNVYCLHVSASDNPNLGRVSIADRRWFWPRKHIKRDYNIRRRVGYKRAKDPNADAVTLDILDRIWYAPFSLREPELGAGGKWTADQILLDVLAEACSYEGITDFSIDPNLGAKIRNIPIEDLSLDESADNAIAHVLTFLPEAGISVDIEGKIRVFSRASGREFRQRQNLGPEIVGRGHSEYINYDRLRPSEVHVLFTRECEVRFDFFESASAARATITTNETDARRCENVMPSPDFVLELKDGRQVPQGTWITFDEAFTSKGWQNVPGVKLLDHDIVQQALLPHMDLWTVVAKMGTTDPQHDWASRIAAITRHYRKTFRVTRRWIDRIHHMRANRVAMLDSATASRAPAPVYADYAYVCSQRSMITEYQGDEQDATYYMNVNGYPSGGLITDETVSSPAMLQILDADQGIVHVDYVVDANRVFEMMLPSHVDESNLPCGNIRSLRAERRCIGWNAIKAKALACRLKPSHRLSFIVSCVAGGGLALHKIVVKPNEIADLLPSNLDLGLSRALGPPIELRVGAMLEMARVQWKDGRAADTEACFGIPNRNAVPKLDGLVINEGSNSDARNGASLNAIAKAVAARVYAGYTNRYEGMSTGMLNPQVMLDGWMTEVTHQITTAGEGTTSISMPTHIPKFDLLSLLDDASRQVLLRTAQG